MGLLPKPLSAAAIWEYAVRTLTNLPDARAALIDNLTRLDTVLSTFRATEFGRIDVAISSRSTLTKADLSPELPRLDALVSSRVTINELTGRTTLAAGAALSVQPASERKALVTFGHDYNIYLDEQLYDGTSADFIADERSDVGKMGQPCIVSLNSRYARCRNHGTGSQTVSYTAVVFYT